MALELLMISYYHQHLLPLAYLAIWLVEVSRRPFLYQIWCYVSTAQSVEGQHEEEVASFSHRHSRAKACPLLRTEY